jgi:LysR family hydrogen peroxide-inducible transcriptional activator
MLSGTHFSLTQLEYVMAVAKHGHFARAAEACGVTQPTLSMQIQKLEESLDVVIFDRSKKPILLTEVGAKLVEQIQSILFETKKFENILTMSKSSSVEGELSLGVIPTVAPYVLPRLLPYLEKEYPGLQLRIIEMQTDRIIAALNNDELDVGLLATPLKIPQIHEYALFYEPFSVLCNKNHELAKNKRAKYSNLKHEDIWLLEEGHCLRHQVLDVCSIKKDRKHKARYEFESGSLETLKSLVDAYGGYTFLPALATDHVGSNSVLIPFERPIPAREIGLAYRREHYKKEMIEALGDATLASIPEEVRKIRMKDLDILPVQS